MQARELLERQLVRGLGRVDPRLEQRLVGVDVAHPGDAALIHDRLLDRRARALEPVGEHEGGERLLQRLGSDPTSVGIPALLVEQPHGAQAPHVSVHQQATVFDRTGEHRVFCLVPGERPVVHHERSGHAGLHDQPVAARQAKHRVLGAPDHLLDGVAPQRAQQAGLRNPAQHVRLGQTGARDAVALEPRGQLPHDRLNLGQLRHPPPFS